MRGLLLLEIRELGANRCSIVAPDVVKLRLYTVLLRRPWQAERASLRTLALSAKLPTSPSLPAQLPSSGPSLDRTCSGLREPKNFTGELESMTSYSELWSARQRPLSVDETRNCQRKFGELF